MIRTLLKDTSGATAIFTAFTLAAAMGFVALGIESASGLHERRQMQDTADAAALAGVLAIRTGGGSDPASVAHAVLSENGFAQHPDTSVSVRSLPEKSRIEVEISRLRPSRFFGLIADAGGEIRVHSAARLEELAEGCLLGLAPEAAIRVNRRADLHLDGCSALSTDDGLSRIRVAEADPYRDLIPAAPTSCTIKAALVSTAMAIGRAHGTVNFCQGLTIASGGTLKLEAGTYTVSGGPLVVQKGARLSGHDVTLLLAAGSSVQFADGAAIDLSAPRSGPWAGLAIAGSGTNGASTMLAGSNQHIVGAIHLPDQSLGLAGSARSPCIQIIAETITITGPTRLENRCAERGIRPIIDRVARLAE